MTNPRIYKIAKGSLDKYERTEPMKAILGGKGAGLHQMVAAGMRVPPAFTITTEVCNAYELVGQQGNNLHIQFLDDLMKEVVANVDHMAKEFGHWPLLSVRSGAAISMPGMMDTILNVGLHDGNLKTWAGKIGERAALDSYRRLIQMLGATAFGVDMKLFDAALDDVKDQGQCLQDSDLVSAELEDLIIRYKVIFKNATGKDFPQKPEDQLKSAVAAVFHSWQNERAVAYRDMNGIPHDIGTACTVQAMVFGNTGPNSGTGVLFTRNPSTGDIVMSGEFLEDAQGEDVVAGIRTPRNVAEMADMNGSWGEVHIELVELCEKLEEMYDDMVDLEFTVQDGVLYILQSRTGKRSAPAAFKIAVDMVKEGKWSIEKAVSKITPAQYKVVRRPRIAAGFDVKPVAVGIPACPGIAIGKAVFSSQAAVDATEPVILVTKETDPDDIAGMGKAVGILTAMGGATSHAAVVARAMDKPCVVGCISLTVEEGYCHFHDGNSITVNKHTTVTIDGATGRIWVGVDVPVEDSSNDPDVKQVLDWCVELEGGIKAVAVDTGVQGEAQRIMACEWWGDEEVAAAVLHGLGELGDCKGVILDLTPPSDFRPGSDALLEHAFGGEPDTADFAATVVQSLLQIDGITNLIVNVDIKRLDAKQSKALHEQHLVLFRPKTMADLITSEVCEFTPAFVENVMGGAQAAAQVVQALTTAGAKIELARRAIPAEYAAFTRLGR